MTDTTPTHSEDPAEGSDTTTPTESAGRTPHTEDAAEGDRDTADAASGVDPANRISEA